MLQGIRSKLDLYVETGTHILHNQKTGLVVGGYTFSMGVADLNSIMSLIATFVGILLTCWLLWMYIDEWKDNKKTKKIERRRAELEVEHLEALRVKRNMAG